MLQVLCSSFSKFRLTYPVLVAVLQGLGILLPTRVTVIGTMGYFFQFYGRNSGFFCPHKPVTVHLQNHMCQNKFCLSL